MVEISSRFFPYSSIIFSIFSSQNFLSISLLNSINLKSAFQYITMQSLSITIFFSFALDCTCNIVAAAEICQRFFSFDINFFFAVAAARQQTLQLQQYENLQQFIDAKIKLSKVLFF